ncbi:MAG TPA: creatininase family protein [bacterium]|uniref:Creatinine amidohydrolase n=1 Tax=candidate division TA06 bacterium ADurb.Bin417 TaxID=1852828 RepID=A0A1V5MFP3_UNCT6|nr:MAG: Creatinine amidohydrolase [candidate division TA06 bacterium ADurb.Bin417]HNQ35641.1 creatininase family protein [bacterium]HNS49098.1 creatininase family protein [bacterium]
MKKCVEVPYLRPAEILAAREKTSLIFLPVAPLEWHGPHLPLGTDPLNAYQNALFLARELDGLVMPPLFIGTERERRPEMLKSIGFKPSDYVVGMDFPKNSLPSQYFKEEVFALVLRNQLKLLADDWRFRRIVIANGHGAENQIAVIQRLKKEFEGTRPVRVLLMMPLVNFPGDNKWSHATLEETNATLFHYPESVDLKALPAGKKPLKNLDWAIIDDLTFRGRPAPGFTVRPEEDPRRATPAQAKKQVLRTRANCLRQVRDWLAREAAKA